MARHRFRIREIAQQSGLSEATVDRALHRRPGVRESTIAEVDRAIAELDRQRDQLSIVGRTFMLDLVMQAPQRFSSAVRAALEAELPMLRPAVIRSRFHLREESSPEDVVAVLEAVGARGSHGVILKAPDVPLVADAIDALADAGIPVVTLVTDVAHSRRAAYVGIDNRSAGATAAFLVSRWTGSAGGTVLVTSSSSSFRGEEEREMGFRATLRSLAPERGIRVITDTDGLDATLRDAVGATLADDPSIDAVYSIGGGNTATIEAFDSHGRTPQVFVAHDLDGDNATLLRQGHVDVVLHHDLRDDMRRACRTVLQAHGAIPGPITSLPSHVQVVTRFNEPSAFRAGPDLRR